MFCSSLIGIVLCGVGNVIMDEAAQPVATPTPIVGKIITKCWSKRDEWGCLCYTLEEGRSFEELKKSVDEQRMVCSKK